MASRKDHEVYVVPSVFDRLTDYDPRSSSDPPRSLSNSLAEYKQSVLRDLMWLLNTRSYPVEIDERLEEVSQSVVTYGLPDFTGISAKSNQEMGRITAELEKAIQVFEPRLLDVKVKLEPVRTTDRELRFRVEAFLNVEPDPEPLAFDTVLELGSGDFEIREG